MQRYLFSLLFCSLTSTVIAALFKLTTPKLMKRFRAKWCYYAWVTIIIGLIIPLRSQFKSTFIELPSNIEIFQSLDSPIYSDNIGNHNQEDTTTLTHTLITALWAFGALLYFSVNVIRHTRFTRSVKRWSKDEANGRTLDLLCKTKNMLNIRADVKVTFCEYVDVPLMTGIIRPCIVLPFRDYSNDELSVIFKHELTHYKHKDLWIKLLSILAISLHWFNPVLKLFLNEMSAVCEIACDDAVLKNAELNERKQYGMTILKAMRSTKLLTAFSTAFAIRSNKLYRRVGVIMNMKHRSTGVLIFLVVIALTVSSGMAFSPSERAAESDYIGGAYMKEHIIDGTIRGDNSTDRYITGGNVKPEPEIKSDAFSYRLHGAYAIDLRYRYSFDISQKDIPGRVYNTKVLFDYDFALSDYIDYDDLNRLIGTYFTFFEETFAAASFDDITQEDGLVLILKTCKEYVEQHADPRLAFRYYLSGMVSDAPISVPFEKINR